jgi:peptide/nickel transport system substrate-binding protein
VGGELAAGVGNGRLRALSAAVCVLALLAAAPAWGKDDLVIGVSQFPASMHPDIDPEQVKAYVLGFAMRPLSAFDKDWKNTCMLCTELPTLQNGLVHIEGSGMAVTVKLRGDRFWGDGVPVTTADLAFTARLGHDPMSGFADTHFWDSVASVEVIDAHTAVLHYTRINALYDRLPDILPAHIEAPVYAPVAGTGAYVGLSVYNRAPTTPGLYDGPYLITQYIQGQSIVLEPNPYWTGHPVSIKRIVLKAIGNTAALQANLLSGDIDMAPGDAPSLSIDQVLELRRREPERFSYIFRPSLTYEHIDLDLDNPILRDLRVRRALLLAIDRQTLVSRLFAGLQPVADGFVDPLDPVHATGLAEYPYDPAQARELLRQAGWTEGADGIRRNAKGEILSLEFATTSGDRLRELVQQVLQSQWKAVGIEVAIHNEPARSFFGQTMAHRAFTGMAMYAWSSGISYPPRQMLASDQIPSAANNWGGGNYMGLRNATVDRDIATTETDLNADHRRVAWDEIQRIYAEQLPALPLYFRAEATVLPKWLHGVTPTGHVDSSSLWSEYWYAK